MTWRCGDVRATVSPMSDAAPHEPERADPFGKGKLLRSLSQRAVLEAVFEQGPITRPEIAAATRLSRPTVASVIEDLEQRGLIQQIGTRTGGGVGRKPMAYEMRRDVGFVVAVDIGGSNVRVGAADVNGDFITTATEPIDNASKRSLAKQVTRLVMQSVAESRVAYGKPLALAIATPGVVNQRSLVVESLAHNVTPDGRFDPVAALGKRLGVPTFVDNNANLSAEGERWNGCARGTDSFVYVSIGAGVGMGLVINGEVVPGSHGGAGEIGYLPVGSDPFDTRHRRRGALEDDVAAAGLLAKAANAPWNGSAPRTVPELFARAQDGDPLARRLLDDTSQRIGLGIAMVCAVVDPELVVIGGGIGASELLLPSIRGAVASIAPLPVRIEISALGEMAPLQGAACVALRSAHEQIFASVSAESPREAAV